MATKITPNLVAHRYDEKNEAAIVFVHGFGGNLEGTWQNFPTFLTQAKELKDWSVFSLGYSTSLRLDIRGIWSADPPLDSVADLVRTNAGLPPLQKYKSIALIAHSMGGLVVQRALVDDDAFAQRVNHLFLFGTPSAGLIKAWWARIWKRSIENMAAGSKFIKDLRQQWTQKNLLANQRFVFRTVAGDQDEFVPRSSSIEPFPLVYREVVDGNHVSMVKPKSAADRSVQIVLKGLIGQAAPVGPGNAARMAVEARDFRAAIAQLGPTKDGLDQEALVQLALALEGVGRQADAIELLEARCNQKDTDARGVLAGRLKRRWLVERVEADAEKAQQLYADAFVLAEANEDHAQAFYHGINLAFMLLLFRRERKKAEAIARKVLDHCALAPPEKWRLATEGEAQLILGKNKAALQSYQQAVALGPTPRELRSMCQQALLVAGQVQLKAGLDRLEAVFQGGNP